MSTEHILKNFALSNSEVIEKNHLTQRLAQAKTNMEQTSTFLTVEDFIQTVAHRLDQTFTQLSDNQQTSMRNPFVQCREMLFQWQEATKIMPYTTIELKRILEELPNDPYETVRRA
jgi:hypothetical protein